MANLTQPLAIKGKYNEKKIKSIPLAAVKIFRGAMVVLSTANFVNKPTNTLGERFLGVALETVDNSGGAAGDKEIRVATDGMWAFAKTGTITQTLNAGQNAYISDDQTITLTPNNNWCGKVSHVESVGDSINTIWYDISAAAQALPAGSSAEPVVLIMPFQFANLANAALMKMVVPFNFLVMSVGVRVGAKAPTTAAKLATLTGQIGGVAMTGGVISPTSANVATAGLLLAGTAVTALNTGTAGATIEINPSAVTAFVEGEGWIEWQLAKL